MVSLLFLSIPSRIIMHRQLLLSHWWWYPFNSIKDYPSSPSLTLLMANWCFQFHQGLSDEGKRHVMCSSVYDFQFHQGLSCWYYRLNLKLLRTFNSIKDYQRNNRISEAISTRSLSIPSRIINPIISSSLPSSLNLSIPSRIIVSLLRALYLAKRLTFNSIKDYRFRGQ